VPVPDRIELDNHLCLVFSTKTGCTPYGPLLKSIVCFISFLFSELHYIIIQILLFRRMLESGIIIIIVIIILLLLLSHPPNCIYRLSLFLSKFFCSHRVSYNYSTIVFILINSISATTICKNGCIR
jgi:hypothetical protein